MPGAKFCSQCGVRIPAAGPICPHCQSQNEVGAKQCYNCGHSLTIQLNGARIYSPRYPLEFQLPEKLTSQIRNHFFKDFQEQIEEQLDRNGFRKYFDHFYKSGFYKNFDRRTEQLAEEVRSVYLHRPDKAAEEADQLLSRTFHAFIDHFILVHAKPIHKLQLPQKILRYHDLPSERLDLRQMILDYLDFEHESEKVYVNFLQMPATKLRNATQSFLFAAPEEKLFFICDQTVFGSCREGFAMTDQALYWKSHFNPAMTVRYNELSTIRRESEWLSINDLFFNVSPSMNLKMLKLLRKIKSLKF